MNEPTDLHRLLSSKPMPLTTVMSSTTSDTATETEGQEVMDKRSRLPPTDFSSDGALQLTHEVLTMSRGVYAIVNDSPPSKSIGEPRVKIAIPPSFASSAELLCGNDEGILASGGQVAVVTVKDEVARVVISHGLAMELIQAQPYITIRKIAKLSPAFTIPARPDNPPNIPHRFSRVKVHVQNVGDLDGPYGEWVGHAQNALWIEGLTVLPPEELENDDIEYQVALSATWYSPWFRSGDYCGSQGIGLPIFGVRVKLSERARQRFLVTCAGRWQFGRQSFSEPPSDEFTGVGENPLTQLNIKLAKRVR